MTQHELKDQIEELRKEIRQLQEIVVALANTLHAINTKNEPR